MVMENGRASMSVTLSTLFFFLSSLADCYHPSPWFRRNTICSQIYVKHRYTPVTFFALVWLSGWDPNYNREDQTPLQRSATGFSIYDTRLFRGYRKQQAHLWHLPMTSKIKKSTATFKSQSTIPSPWRNCSIFWEDQTKKYPYTMRQMKVVFLWGFAPQSWAKRGRFTSKLRIWSSQRHKNSNYWQQW